MFNPTARNLLLILTTLAALLLLPGAAWYVIPHSEPLAIHLAAAGTFVASISANTFHRVTCRKVSQIKPQDLEFYGTRQSALTRNRRPCNTCNPWGGSAACADSRTGRRSAAGFQLSLCVGVVFDHCFSGADDSYDNGVQNRQGVPEVIHVGQVPRRPDVGKGIEEPARPTLTQQ